MFFKENDEVFVSEKSATAVKAKIRKVIKETCKYEIDYYDGRYNSIRDKKTNKLVDGFPEVEQYDLLKIEALNLNYNLLYKNNKEEISSILTNLKKPDISPIVKRSRRTTKDGRKKSSRKKPSKKKSKKSKKKSKKSKKKSNK